MDSYDIAKGRDAVQQVNTFQDLFYSGQPALRHSTHYASLEQSHELHDDTLRSLNYLQDLLDSSGSQTLEEELRDPYDFYPDYQINVPNHSWPPEATWGNEEHDDHQIQHNDVSQGSLRSRTGVDDANIHVIDGTAVEEEGQSHQEDRKKRRCTEEMFRRYCHIYRRFTGCSSRIAIYRVRAKLTNDLKQMLDSNDVKQIKQACRILSCRDPTDALTIEETAQLISKIADETKMSRKQASNVVRMGLFGFPLEKKEDLFSQDQSTFDAAFEILYLEYTKRNAKGLQTLRARQSNERSSKEKERD